MRSSHDSTRGFTLVEILIVVVILGILATLVTPQFSNATELSSENTALSQLRTLRGQIALHDLRIVAGFDPLTNQWDQLIANDMLVTGPRNPLQGGSTTVAAAAAAGVGWVWADLTGSGVDLYVVGPADVVLVHPDTGDPY